MIILYKKLILKFASFKLNVAEHIKFFKQSRAYLIFLVLKFIIVCLFSGFEWDREFY